MASRLFGPSDASDLGVIAFLPFPDGPAASQPAATFSPAAASATPAEEPGLTGLFALQLLALLAATEPTPEEPKVPQQATAEASAEASEAAPPEATQDGQPIGAEDGAGKAGRSSAGGEQTRVLPSAEGPQVDPVTPEVPTSEVRTPVAPKRAGDPTSAAGNEPKPPATPQQREHVETRGEDPERTAPQRTTSRRESGVEVATEQPSAPRGARQAERQRKATRESAEAPEGLAAPPPVEKPPSLWKTPEPERDWVPVVEWRRAGFAANADLREPPPSAQTVDPEASAPPTAQDVQTPTRNSIEVEIKEIYINDSKIKRKQIQHKISDLPGQPVEKSPGKVEDARLDMVGRPVPSVARTPRVTTEPPRAAVWTERLTVVKAEREATLAVLAAEKPSRSTSFPQAVPVPESLRSNPLEPATAKSAVKGESLESLPAALVPSDENPSQASQGGDRRESDARSAAQQFAEKRPFQDRSAPAPPETSDLEAPASAGPPPGRAAIEQPDRPGKTPERAGLTEPAARPVTESTAAVPRTTQSSQSAAPQPPVNSAAPVSESPVGLRQFGGNPAERPATPSSLSAERAEAALQVSASELRRSPDATRLTLRLEDDRLGSLALRLAERGGGVEVMLRTDNATAAKQFQNNLPQLYENLLQRGLQPDARAAWTPSASPDSDRRQQEQERRQQEARQHFRGRRGQNSESLSTFSVPVS